MSRLVACRVILECFQDAHVTGLSICWWAHYRRTLISVPLDCIANTTDTGASSFRFHYGLGSPSPKDTKLAEEGVSKEDGKESICKEETSFVQSSYVKQIVADELLKLFEAARDYGKESLKVRLEVQVTPAETQSPQIMNLFVFPFLSREYNKKVPGHSRRYQRMIDAVANNAWPEARPILDHIMSDWMERGFTESTVIAQVLIPCDEIFCVRDASTGDVIQGHGDEKVRRVVHLVRFEMVVRSYLKNDGSWFPVRSELGEWHITDIDDLLEGNLLL